MINFDLGPVDQITMPPRFIRDLNLCKRFMTRAAPGTVAAAEAEMHRILAGGEVHTTSWIPGADWWGKPWWPIYEFGARQHPDVARKYFGLFAWQCVLEREQWYGEHWGCEHCLDQWGHPIKGRTYFLLHNWVP